MKANLGYVVCSTDLLRWATVQCHTAWGFTSLQFAFGCKATICMFQIEKFHTGNADNFQHSGSCHNLRVLLLLTRIAQSLLTYKGTLSVRDTPFPKGLPSRRPVSEQKTLGVFEHCSPTWQHLVRDMFFAPKTMSNLSLVLALTFRRDRRPSSEPLFYGFL